MKLAFTLLLIFTFSSIDLLGFDYDGFSIDETILKDRPGARSILEDAFKRQVDIVNAADLPPAMLAIIHSIPITATIDTSFSYAGEYIQKEYAPPISFTGAYIYLNASTVFSFRYYMPEATLLHEFIHVIHDLYPPGSFSDSEIEGYFLDAQKRGCYGFSDYTSTDPYKKDKEYLFTNYIEFFAQTASTYLHGRCESEPFSRREIEEEQPEYYAFLQKFFNPAYSRYNAYYGWLYLENSIY